MASPSSTIPLPLPIAGWRLPVLGVLLTGLGVGLLAVGVKESASPTFSARPANVTANSAVMSETSTDRFAPAAPMRFGGSLAWGGAWSGGGEAVLAAPGRSGRSFNCLGADLATGRRAESAHLATVPLLRPADCGDARDAITAMAALRHTGPQTAADPQPTDVAADPRQPDSIDLVAAALYGPPDRQPQATQEKRVLDGGRGLARDFLERSATRLMAP